MNGKDIELSRRRVLGGIATVGAASAAAGAGTFAYFSDTETSEGNTISAGTLDLETAGSSEGDFQIMAENLKPDETAVEVGYLDVKNSGNIDGDLSLEITDITDEENGTNPPEEDAEDDLGIENYAASGELSDFLTLDIYIDESPENGERNETTTVGTDLPLNEGVIDTDQTLSENDEIRLWFDVTVDKEADNRIQSDKTLIDATIHLDQSGQ